MSTQKNLKNWELKNNSLKDRIEFLMTPQELEKPYSFATRVGLAKGTFTGIWIKGRQSLHQGTINKICAATGVDPGWLATGVGVPFPIYNYDEIINRQVEEAYQDRIAEDEIIIELDTSLLIQAFETLDKALLTTGRVMQPKGRARFVATVYSSLKENEEMDIKLLEDCIFTIEEALKSTRRTMSPKSKTDLILIVYELYSGNASYKEAMTSTINQLIRSVS